MFGVFIIAFGSIVMLLKDFGKFFFIECDFIINDIFRTYSVDFIFIRSI